MPRTFLSLNVHIVFSTKNRQPLISEEIQPDLHAYLGGVTKTLGAAPMKVGGVADHIHLLIGIKGTHAVSDLVREIKKTSSSWVSERMRDRRFAWQEGFSAFSVSAERTSGVTKYIATQAEHHFQKSFEEELIELLTFAKIPFDPQYLF